MTETNFVIEFDEREIKVTDKARQISILWLGVKKIAVFKRDLYTVDLICLLIESEDRISELNEDMEGWQNLIEKLPEHLEGCRNWAEWYLEVAFPAFETNAIVIYERNDF